MWCFILRRTQVEMDAFIRPVLMLILLLFVRGYKWNFGGGPITIHIVVVMVDVVVDCVVTTTVVVVVNISLGGTIIGAPPCKNNRAMVTPVDWQYFQKRDGQRTELLLLCPRKRGLFG